METITNYTNKFWDDLCVPQVYKPLATIVAVVVILLLILVIWRRQTTAKADIREEADEASEPSENIDGGFMLIDG